MLNGLSKGSKVKDRLRRKLRRRGQRGAVFVEAVGIIVMLVFLWNAMWMMLLHYSFKLNGNQSSRRAVWQWAIKDLCDEESKPAGADSGNSTGSGAEEKSAAEDQACQGQSDNCNTDTTMPGDTGPMNTDLGGLDAVQSASNISGNIVRQTTTNTYFNRLIRGDQDVNSIVELECNNDGLSIDGVGSDIAGLLKGALDIF